MQPITQYQNGKWTPIRCWNIALIGLTKRNSSVSPMQWFVILLVHATHAHCVWIRLFFFLYDQFPYVFVCACASIRGYIPITIFFDYVSNSLRLCHFAFVYCMFWHIAIPYLRLDEAVCLASMEHRIVQAFAVYKFDKFRIRWILCCLCYDCILFGWSSGIIHSATNTQILAYSMEKKGRNQKKRENKLRFAVAYVWITHRL